MYPNYPNPFQLENFVQLLLPPGFAISVQLQFIATGTAFLQGKARQDSQSGGRNLGGNFHEGSYSVQSRVSTLGIGSRRFCRASSDDLRTGGEFGRWNDNR